MHLDIRDITMDEKPAEQKLGVLGLTNKWASDAACDAIPQIPRVDSIPRKIIWTLICLGLAGYMTYEIVSVFTTFLEFPVNTQLEYKYENNLNFPAVTVCNINPARYSKLSRAGTSFDNLFGTVNGAPVPGRKKRFTQTAENSANQSNRGQERFSFVKAFKKIWAELSHTTRFQMGHHINDMLVSCSFLGETCGARDFIMYSNALFGNCFVFNSGLNENNTIRNSTKVGPQYSFSLELCVEQAEYLPELTEQAAARIFLHDNFVMPFPEDAGFNLAPGYLTSIATRRLQIERKEFPHPSMCYTKAVAGDGLNLNMYADQYNVNYSREACYKTCYQRHVVEICQCADSDYPFFKEYFVDVLVNKTFLRPCLSAVEDQCLTRVQDSYEKNNLTCDCPLACSEVDYTSTLSLSSWPSDQYISTLKQSLLNQGRTDILNSSFAKNLLKVEVFFDTLNYQRVYEVESYSLTSMISDLGGQLGLWLGASFIILFQLVELFIDLFLMGCSRLAKRENQKSPSHTQERVYPMKSLSA